MIVVALLAILGLLGVPQFLGFIPKYRTDAAAKDLVAQMELYRIKSIANNVRHLVTFDGAGQTITVQTADANGTATGVIATLTFEDTGDTYKGVTLGRNATDPLPDSPNGGTTEAAEFGPAAATSFIFLPSGVSTFSGEFFIIPKSDKPGRSDRIIGISLSRAGVVRKYRYDDSQVAGSRWKEF